MRHAVRSVCVLIAVAGVAIACGSGGDSEFVDPNVGGDEAGIPTPPVGNFNPVDGGSDGGNPSCKKLTCASSGANCGPVSDGCIGIIQCGTCTNNETCGGGGKPSVCGKPPCTKKTCAQQGGANCGALGDGCGGLITSCGTCPVGESCGLGGPSKCGAGGLDGGACVPTKTACAAGDCGPIADGCGALIDCSPPAWPACPAGQSCGGGGTPSLCGAPPCVKKTCGTQNCGFIADGCGGVVNCWPAPPASPVCGPGMSCGGAGVPNTCGTAPGCTGLCLQQQTCPGGGTTSIEGYVTSPNGVLPVPNAVVYVPNGAVAAFTPGVKCETCATASGSPLVSTTTDANGHFLLPNMPVSDAVKITNIPVVVQLGKWRKQFTIATTACVNNKVPAYGMATADKTAALPATHLEGDIPLTAISTGAVDGLECVFRKIGVADSEFSDGAGTGRIRLYQDNGALITGATANAATLYSPCVGAGCTNEIDKFDATIFGCVGGQVNKDAASRANVVDYANKGGRVFATHFSYVWLYTTTTPAYTSPWAGTANVWNPGRASWNNTAPPGSLSAFVDTSFPKGVLFSTWLQAPVAPVSATYAPPYAAVNGLYASSPPRIALTEPRKDIEPAAGTTGIVAPAQRWIYTTSDDGATCAVAGDCKSGVCTATKCVGSQIFNFSDFGSACSKDSNCQSGKCTNNKCTGEPAAQNAPMHYTFNTPTPAPAAPGLQCGRVVFSDFHVSVGTTTDKPFPTECDPNPLTAQEKVLAYALFDLASCVSTSAPPACVKKSCADQGLGCGLAGDGCGGPLDCGPCLVAGETCGGGGVPSQCGKPACTKKTCLAGQCGLLGDGCGGQLDCGVCAMGTCGGGGANVCGAAVCMPTGCPAPAPGSVCGPVADGCGKVNNCPCAVNVPCVNGTCGAPPCVPQTCGTRNCGQIADGCGATLNCGTCIAPQTCGGAGVANYCGGGVN